MYVDLMFIVQLINLNGPTPVVQSISPVNSIMGRFSISAFRRSVISQFNCKFWIFEINRNQVKKMKNAMSKYTRRGRPATWPGQVTRALFCKKCNKFLCFFYINNITSYLVNIQKQDMARSSRRKKVVAKKKQKLIIATTALCLVSNPTQRQPPAVWQRPWLGLRQSLGVSSTLWCKNWSVS